MGHELVDQLSDYLGTVLRGKSLPPVLPDRNPDELAAKYRTLLEDRKPFQVRDFFESVLDDSIHLHHPGYIGHQVSAPAPLGAIAGFFGDLLNNGSAIFDMGPANIAMEKILVDLTCRRLGFSNDGDGIFTSGGSIGNLTALLAAVRIRSASGRSSGARLAFLVPEQSHYSIAKSLKIIGVEAVSVPADGVYRMRLDRLPSLLERANRAGLKVIGIVANACSTATGSYDNLEKAASFSERHGLWLHVDGAHGAAAVFSDRYRPLLKGIERADSVVIDFHKMLMTPSLVTAVLFRQSEHSYRTFAEKASYLWSGEEAGEWFNLSKRTLECTKRSLGLMVFTMLKAYGKELFTENIDYLYELAQSFASLIHSRDLFELAMEPQSNIVCFRYQEKGLDTGRLNRLNERIRDQVVRKGNFYLVQASLRGNLFLRTALMNPFTRIDDLERLLDEIEQIGSRIADER